MTKRKYAKTWFSNYVFYITMKSMEAGIGGAWNVERPIGIGGGITKDWWVISMSLKSAKQPNYEMAYKLLIRQIAGEYDRHKYSILRRGALVKIRFVCHDNK